MFEVRKITLPSGKTVEIVYWQQDDAAVELRDLTQCLHCDSELVYPTAWHEIDDCWNVCLRCPECENMEENVFDHPTVELYDENLNQGTDRMIDSLEEMTRYNMRETLGRWIHALEHDLVLPEDF